MTDRGYFGIGIYGTKAEVNVGTLWRSASQLNASFCFTIGRRYKQQSSDTTKTWRHIPLYHYLTFEEMRSALPFECKLVGVEMGGVALESYSHPERAAYLLGAEDHGIPHEILAKCHDHISLSAKRTESYNVAVSGSIVMYDRQFGL